MFPGFCVVLNFRWLGRLVVDCDKEGDCDVLIMYIKKDLPQCLFLIFLDVRCQIRIHFQTKQSLFLVVSFSNSCLPPNYQKDDL
jgi:hypothetical protein